MEYIPSYRDDLYLMHHGIKGMHWGVRRFETAAGHLTSEGKKRYAKYRDDYTANRAAKKEAKQQAKAERAEKVKNALTSDTAKNLAKGAAVTAGLVGAGYLGTIAMEELADQKNYKKARNIGEQLVAEHYGDMSAVTQNALRKALTDMNYQRLSQQGQLKRSARKQAVKDAANAYINPRRANADARSEFRSRVRSGQYTPDASKALGLETIDSSNYSKYRTGFDNLAARTENPAEFDRKVREERRKAEEAHKKEYEEQIRKVREKYGYAMA